MCPYCKERNIIIKETEIKLTPNEKYYRNLARIGLCRSCHKEHLITSEYIQGREAEGPFFHHRKFEEVEVV